MRGLWVSMSTGGRTAPSLTITFVVFGAADITTRAYLDRFPPVRLKVAGGLAACFFDLSSSGRFFLTQLRSGSVGSCRHLSDLGLIRLS